MLINEANSKGGLRFVTDLSAKCVRIGSLLAGIVFLIGAGLYDLSLYSSYTQSLQKGDQEIADYQKQLLVENAKLDDTTKQVSNDTASVYSMQSAGNEIASLQDQYAQLSDSYGLSYEEKPSDMTEELQQVRSSLESYFGSTGVYQWFDWPSDEGFHWSCVTTYDITGDHIDALWLCKNGTTVGAYATAVYDAVSDTFSDLQVHVTQEGETFVMQEDQG